jgi:purine-binding chemotaxis protein CheW
MSNNDEFDDREPADDTQKDRYLLFRLGDEDYGLEIGRVKEIVGCQRVTAMPDMPSYVRGVINLRGSVIPVIDMRVRFHMEQRAYDDRTCVIVVTVNGTSIGFIVDTVCDVREITKDNISPPPSVGGEGASSYILGLGKVGDEVKILLDINKLFGEQAEELKGRQA